MIEEPLSRGASPSGDGGSCGPEDINTARIVTSLMDERLLDITTKLSLNPVRTSTARKAKRVRFFRNGDKFYTGVVMAVTSERYRSFDSLATDLTRALISSVTLPSGVRAIYTMDGRKVQSVNDLEDGKCYVCSGQGEVFKKVEYSSSKVRRGSSLSGLPQSPAGQGTGRPASAAPGCVRARIVTLIRHGTKPRKVVRLLLSKRNAPSLERALEAITDAVKLDSGAVRRVYTLSGQQVSTLEHFFETEEIFLAYGNDKSCQEDFELDFEESKAVQSFRRGPWVSRRQGGPMPRMPRKSGKKPQNAPQVRTPSPASLLLPQPLRIHYAVGHVIGDGNFAVVRHSVHKTTGTEYAMKIVDKYKCQGRENMLASEVAILRQVCHPNIISLIAEQETTDQLFLVMELVKGGDLFDAIAAATKFSESEASVMIGHLTSALAYLHSHHIVHRDVKPENLLVEMEGSRVRCLKLGDFGLAQVVREPLYTVCGTPTYVAPEILAETGYGLKIDVWAAGVILYILLCGFPPFVSPENEQEELFERILSGQYEFTSPYWDSVSEAAKQLIANMLQAQPELRFSAEDVLDHPWLASFLGGEQTAAAESAEQHRNKQRQPIRQATFDFNYRKHGDASTGEDPSNASWSDIVAWNRKSLDDIQSRGLPFDEVDFTNGNHCQEDEPRSLSAACVGDIRAVTKSMHDLMDNLTRTDNDVCAYSYRRAGSGHSSVSSLDGMTGSNDSPRKNGRITNVNTAYNDQSPIHSASRRNGASLSSIHSKLPVTSSPAGRGQTRGSGPDSPRSAISTERLATLGFRRKHLSPLSANRSAVRGIDPRSRDKLGFFKTSRDRVFDSTDGSVNASNDDTSDNEIETSDSFVNIKFAKRARSPTASSSSQSLESTDSFENVRFTWEDKNRLYDGNGNSNGNDNEPNSIVTSVQSSTSDPQVPVGSKSTVQTKHRATGSSKACRPSRIPGVNQGQQNSTNNSGVKRRERQATPRACSKTGNRAELNKSSGMAGGDRKFNSNEDVREEKQQQSTRSKRHSLYYTPQPCRKIYEPEKATGRSAKKSLNEVIALTRLGDPIDRTKRSSEATGSSEKKERGTRKSVLQTSTAASRNRSNKQTVHIRGSTAKASDSSTGRAK